MDDPVKSESSNNLLRLFLPSSPCRVVKWVVSTGARVRKGTILMTYTTDLSTSEPADELPLKSTLVGVVKERAYEEGEIVKPGNAVVVLEERCDHSVIVYDMCTDCGRNLRSQSSDRGGTSEGEHATVTVVHGIPGIRISQKEAEALGREDKLRLLKSRKLALIVDLDQTLIHTSVDPNIEPGLQDVYGFKLPEQPILYHCRLRPYAREFLEKISKQYEMHVFTMGTNSYAASITKILDPGKKLFCDRIISRDECFDPFSKAPRLKSVFPCGDEMVAIIDDREDVWSRCPNLIHVKPYVFFAGTADINAPPPRPSAPPTSSSTTATDTPDCLPFKTRHMSPPSNKPRVTIATTTKHHQSPLVDSAPPPSRDNDIVDNNTTSVTEDKTTSNAGDRTLQSLASAPSLVPEKDMQGLEGTSHVDTNSSESKKVAIERTSQTDEIPSMKSTSEGDDLDISSPPTIQGNTNNNNNNGEGEGDPKMATEEGDSSSSSSSDSSSEGEDEGPDGEVKGHDGEDKGHEGDAEGGDGSSSSSSDSSGIDDDLFDSLEENVEEAERASGGGGLAESVEVRGAVELNKDKVAPLVAGAEERMAEVREEGRSVDIVSKATEMEEGDKGKVELGGSIPVSNEGGEGNLSNEMETDTPPSTAPSTLTPSQPNNIIQKPSAGRRRSIEVKDPDNFLVHLGDILTRLHDRFYKEFDDMVEGIDIEQVDKIPTPDLKRVIPDVRHSVLKGTRILFTGVIPTNMPPIKNREWNTARAFGAIIHDHLVPGLHSTDPAKAFGATTHVIAGRPGTSKLKEAKRLPGVKIVSTKWLWACAEQWKLVDERAFPPVFDKEKEDEGHQQQRQSSKDNGKAKSTSLKPPRKTMKVISENSEEGKAVPTNAVAPPTSALAPPTQQKAKKDSEPIVDQVPHDSGNLGSTEKDTVLDSDSDSDDDDDAFQEGGKMEAADFERDPAMLQRLREFKRHLSLESRLSVSDEELEKMDAEVEAEISSSSDSGENLGTFIEEKDDDTLLSYESYAGSDHDASNCERTGSIVERQSRKRKHIDIENNSSSSNSPIHEHLNDSIEPSDDENFDSDNDSNDSIDELGALLG